MCWQLEDKEDKLEDGYFQYFGFFLSIAPHGVKGASGLELTYTVRLERHPMGAAAPVSRGRAVGWGIVWGESEGR